MVAKKNFFALLFWVLIWQIASVKIDSKIFLPSPFSVFEKTFSLFFDENFYKIVIFSFSKIAFGFFLGVFVAVIFASLSNKFKMIEILIKPLMLTIKSVPVASFIILVLIWFSSKNLSILISFLMVLPIIYTNVLQGLHETDEKTLEMCKVYKIPLAKKIRYVYIFEVFPYFKSAISVALGLAFKAGIAGEVIGLPNNSIGAEIYNSKIYLDTVSLFAWTIVVVLLSLLFEMIIVNLFEIIVRKLEKL
ncbi:MAG: ABC transporter permease subunit [Clostridia bacterium]